MPAHFLINAAHRIVFSHGSGPLTQADFLAHMNGLLADARFRPDFRQIVDFTDCDMIQLTGEQVRQLARRSIFGPGSRRAFVVASDLQFGLGRLFATRREFEGEKDFGIFRSMAEAIAWVPVPAEIAAAAFAELRARS